MSSTTADRLGSTTDGNGILTCCGPAAAGRTFLAGLRHHVPVTLQADAGPGTTALVGTLSALAAADGEWSPSKFLMREASSIQFAEFLVHRSLYHLKEADPHTWGIKRLSGSIKGAMVNIQADAYGGGATPMMRAQLFRQLMLDRNLDDLYGRYLDSVPGLTLMATNLISTFGLLGGGGARWSVTWPSSR